jgi:hypothetical protein
LSAFFEADQFKGLIITQQKSKQEAYFKQNKIISIVNNKDNQSLLQSLVKIQVSTDFNERENKFLKNFASLVNHKSNPCLLMHFDPIENDLEFTIKWIDPNHIQQKKVNVHLNKSSSYQFVQNYLFKPKYNDTNYDLNSSGIWKIEISTKNDTLDLLSFKFLVLPDKNEILSEKWLNYLGEFWLFDSVCDENDCKNIFWSTFYPDPKSDLNESLTINVKNRIS